MGRQRRAWIDNERKTNPAFAPDIESAKELLSRSELAETREYEALRHKFIALDSRAKPFAVTVKERKRFIELHRKYKHVYYTTQSSLERR